jgi:hypothetical protein
LQEKRPGVEQMVGDPATSKLGDKAGEFFRRIGAKLGKEMAKAVEEIYRETEDDLTHTANAVRGLKVVAKTASLRKAALKKAGLSDVVVSVKEWLAGRADSLVQRIINFTGDIKKWLRGFQTRTAIVKKETMSLLAALDDARSSIDSALS